MRKSFKFMLLAAVAALGLMVSVGDVGAVGAKVYPLDGIFDLDGEPADPDQVLGVTVLLNGANDYSAGILLNPDVCRLVDITIVDAAGVTGGPITVTGTDCWGDPLTATYNFTAGDDDGAHPLVVTVGQASGAYFSTVTAITSGVLAGCAGADTMTVGYTFAAPVQYTAYGVRKDNTQIWGGGPTQGIRWVDPASRYPISILVANQVPGTPGTILSAVVPLSAPFTRVAVGDLIYLQEGVFQPGVTTSPFRVVAWADANNITLDRFFLTKTAGVGFQYQRHYVSSDPQDGYLPVAGADAVSFIEHNTTAGTSPGGVDTYVECTSAPYAGMVVPFIQVATHHIASGAASQLTDSVDLRLVGFTFCRYGLRLTTGDDVDAAAANVETISATMTQEWTSVQ